MFLRSEISAHNGIIVSLRAAFIVPHRPVYVASQIMLRVFVQYKPARFLFRDLPHNTSIGISMRWELAVWCNRSDPPISGQPIPQTTVARCRCASAPCSSRSTPAPAAAPTASRSGGKCRAGSPSPPSVSGASSTSRWCGLRGRWAYEAELQMPMLRSVLPHQGWDCSCVGGGGCPHRRVSRHERRRLHRARG